MLQGALRFSYAIALLGGALIGADKPDPRDQRIDRVLTLRRKRDLAACIRLCEAYLKTEDTDARKAQWTFYKGECLYRLWRFKEARAALQETQRLAPDSPPAKQAQRLLRLIEPNWTVDPHGIVQGYHGKYVKDIRFQAAIAELPKFLPQARRLLAQRLGLDVAKDTLILFRFADWGNSGKGGRTGQAQTVCWKGKPVTLITFSTERLVVCPADFRQLIVHELKHAVLRNHLGQQYLKLPKWVKEGLAVWAAGEGENRIAAIISNQMFMQAKLASLCDGIEVNRDLNDYLENYLAFAWLESRGAGNVKRFAQRLYGGEDYDKVFADLAGMPFTAAMNAANAYCRQQIKTRAGAGWEELRQIRQRDFAMRKNGMEAYAAWSGGRGAELYTGWLRTHPNHVLAANARYRLGQALVLGRHFERARTVLQEILKRDLQRSSLGDDAAYWIAESYRREGHEEEAKKAFGVLLRDFAAYRAARNVPQTYKPAGPVTK